MKLAPKLENEELRLADLRNYQILDTLPEDCFDEITALAREICGTDIALISLVDSQRQWFKSKQNLDAEESAREISFCGHAVQGTNLFEISDASNDERFHDNPFVTEDPHIRFYAGMPLITPRGFGIGTLCVIDSEPKKLTAIQQLAMKVLSNNVIQILELRLNNSELQNTQNLMNEFQQVAKIGGWELDLTTSKTKWTREVYNIYQIPEETPTDKIQGLAAYPDFEQTRLTKMIENCITEADPIDGIFEFIDSKGNHKWVHNLGRRIDRQDGTPDKIVGTIQDVSEQIEREKEAHRQGQFLSDTINNLPSLFYTRASDGDLLLANTPFKKQFTVEETTLLGKDFNQIVGEKNFELMNSLDQKVIESGEILESEDLISDLEGNKRVFNSYRFPYKEANNSLFATGCISIDITDKRVLETQALHSAKLASIGEMAAGAGHEINNPLSIIVGYVGKLKKQLKEAASLNGATEESLNGIEKSAFRISKIVSGIRSFSRLDTNDQGNFELVEVLEDSIGLVQEIYQNEGVETKFINNLKNNDVYIYGNRGQIQQVLINLISNARDATVKVTTPLIEIRCTEQDEQIIITVKDNGHGIPDSVKDKIFDPFFTTKPVNKGTGIGLSLARQFIEFHEGSIKVESGANQGTTFTLKLPISSKNENISRTEGEFDLNKLFELNNQQILVVDDEPEIRALIREGLSTFGFQVYDASNGEAALEILRKHRDQIKLVICDIRMPVMNGIELYEQIIKEKLPCPQFILITGGINLDEHTLKKLENRVDGFLYKPFGNQQLFERVTEALSSTSQA